MSKLLNQLYNASKYSLNGLMFAWRSEYAFRIEVVLFLISLPCALMLATSACDAIFLLGSVLWILIIELLNTAVETTVNRIGLDHHELSGLAKDLGSAATFVASINAAMIWGFILIHHLFLK